MDMSKLSSEQIAELFDKYNKYPEVKESEMLAVADVDFSNLSHKELTCKNHPLSLYYSKNPFSRGLHLIQGPNGIHSMLDDECNCPFADLRVVIREK